MLITGTGSVAEQTWITVGGDGFSLVLCPFLRVTDAATVGSLNAIYRWTDPVVGNQTKTVTILLTVLNGFKADAFPVDLAPSTLLTIECQATSLLGTTAFEVDTHYAQLYE